MGIFNFFRGRRIFYIPGCLAYARYQEGVELYQRIFKKLGIKFSLFNQNIPCGIELFELGNDIEARKLIRENFEIFKIEEAKKILTTSPECYKMFLQNYEEVLPDWDIEVINTWTLILKQLLKKHRAIKKKAMETVTFHDSCYLGRYSGIYEEPRKILESIGYEIKEMDNSREESFCCGSCGGLRFTNPKLADELAKERILQAKRIGVKKIIVTGFENYDLLKRNIGDKKIEVIEMSEALAHALEINKADYSYESIEGEEVILESE